MLKIELVIFLTKSLYYEELIKFIYMTKYFISSGNANDNIF